MWLIQIAAIPQEATASSGLTGAKKAVVLVVTTLKLLLVLLLILMLMLTTVTTLVVMLMMAMVTAMMSCRAFSARCRAEATAHSKASHQEHRGHPAFKGAPLLMFKHTRAPHHAFCSPVFPPSPPSSNPSPFLIIIVTFHIMGVVASIVSVFQFSDE